MSCIDEIRARLEAATPGDWLITYDIDDPVNAATPVAFCVATKEEGAIAEELCWNDVALVARSKEDLTYLLAALTVATERAERAEKERDARPAITREDAAFLRDLVVLYQEHGNDPEGECTPLHETLRAHAKGTP